MTWEQTLKHFEANIQGQFATALDQLGDDIAAAPKKFEPVVRAVLDSLNRTRANLARLAKGLGRPPRSRAEAAATARYAEMKNFYESILVGFKATIGEDASIDYSALELGFIPAGVVLVVAFGAATVASLAFTVAGIAWAYVCYRYVIALEQESALQNRELDARVEAMRSGKVLQDGTLPAPPQPPEVPKGSSVGWLIGLAAVTGAAVVILPRIAKAWG